MASLFHWRKIAANDLFTFARVLDIRVLRLLQSISRSYKVSFSLLLTCINAKIPNHSEALNDDQSSITYMADRVFSHLLAIEEHREVVVKSLIALIEQYCSWIANQNTLETGMLEQ